ncbi:MAG: hypothetical protein L6433_13830 [Actinomycetia bacterium]|nr:hypothetical protein [Actinomycetota bacterium]MCG2820051.1 hypothetical protein [Actinomycetes bacterium]
MEKLINAEELAIRLGVATSWVYMAARNGWIPRVELGKYVRFDHEEVNKALAENQRLKQRRRRKYSATIKAI